MSDLDVPTYKVTRAKTEENKPVKLVSICLVHWLAKVSGKEHLSGPV